MPALGDPSSVCLVLSAPLSLVMWLVSLRARRLGKAVEKFNLVKYLAAALAWFAFLYGIYFVWDLALALLLNFPKDFGDFKDQKPFIFFGAIAIVWVSGKTIYEIWSKCITGRTEEA